MNLQDRLQNIDNVINRLMKERGEHFAVPAPLHEKQRLMRALMNVREPQPASNELLLAQDRELQMQRTEKGVVGTGHPDMLAFGSRPASKGPRLMLWKGDITRLGTDAIVNAANAQMLGCFVPLHACIDNCIHSAAGIQLRNECQRVMKGEPLPTGKAVITKAYNLPARYVIHTVGPIIAPSRREQITGIFDDDACPTLIQAEQLADCYRSCLQLAADNHLQSIAFCCISTGVFHFPQRQAAKIAVTTVEQWLANNRHQLSHVVFNVFKDSDYDIYHEILQPKA